MTDNKVLRELGYYKKIHRTNRVWDDVLKKWHNFEETLYIIENPTSTQIGDKCYADIMKGLGYGIQNLPQE